MIISLMILDKKIKIFMTIVEKGSFSEAARLLSLSQSVISFHIDSLEKEMGVVLFKRQGRTIEISDIGNSFYDKLNVLNCDIKGIEDDLSHYTKEMSKKIYLSGNSLTCAFTLPIALSIFQKNNPDTIYSYNYKSQNLIINDLLSGRDDLAFVGHKIINKKISNSECFKDEIVLVSKNNNIDEEININELKKIPLVWIKGDIGLELILKKELQKVGIPLNNLNIFMEVEDLAITKSFVRNGIASAFLPKLTVLDELKYGIFKTTKISDLAINRTTYHAFLKDKEPRPIFQKFLNFIKDDSWKKDIIDNLKIK